MTRIVIADDQALFREGLRTLLSTRSDMDVVGEASDGDEAVALVEKLQPAVVLMDLRMPRADGIQATARIRERWPEIPVLVLTTFDDDANLFGALRAGAAGYLLKDVSSETLISAIQAATRGESFLQSTVTGRVVAAFARLMESGGPKAGWCCRSRRGSAKSCRCSAAARRTNKYSHQNSTCGTAHRRPSAPVSSALLNPDYCAP